MLFSSVGRQRNADEINSETLVHIVAFSLIINGNGVSHEFCIEVGHYLHDINRSASDLNGHWSCSMLLNSQLESGHNWLRLLVMSKPGGGRGGLSFRDMCTLQCGPVMVSSLRGE